MQWKRDIRRMKQLMGLIKHLKLPYLVYVVLNAPWTLATRSLAAVFAFNVVNASVEGDLSGIYRSIFQTGGMMLATGIMFVGVGVIGWQLGSFIIHNTSREVFARVMRLPTRVLNEHHSADLLTRITEDTTQAMNALISGLPGVLEFVVSIVVGGIVYYRVSKPIFWFGLAIGIIQVVQSLFYAGPMRSLWKEMREKSGDQTKSMADILRGAPVVRIFNLQQVVTGQCMTILDGLRRVRWKYIDKNTLRVALMSLRGLLTTLAVTVFGMYLVSKGELTVAEVTLLSSMQLVFIGPFSWMANRVIQLWQSLASVDRIMEVLEEADEGEVFGSGSIEVSGDTAISISHLRYRYREDVPLFEDISLQVPRNQTIALVGSSGSGKSTLLKLMMQFYRHQSGEVQVFGQAVENCTLQSLRSQIAYVPQEAPLFDATVYENIVCGKAGVSREDVEKAAKKAYAHDFIMALPDGYDTKVGERGVQLSGGQRQRIAIARAMCKDAPILLLDEATSALDSQSEAQVQLALDALMEGRTIIVVAHRLSTVEKADCIYVLENGQIVENGKHESLLAQNGLYTHLYSMQFSA